MKTKLASLALAVAALSAAAGVADANDHMRTAPGIRYGGGGTPVPAPVPVPDMPSLWYVALSAGHAVASSGKIETTGPDIGAFSSFGENEGPSSFGFSVGRRFFGNWRGDVDFTFRPKQRLTKPTTATYTASGAMVEAEQLNVSRLMIVNGTETMVTRATRSWDISSYDVSRGEEASSANQTFMFNLYYDVPTGSIFTPYIGGGIGLVSRQTSRNYKETGTCTGTQQV
jgi:opacity protein-like surface antigen